MSKKKPRSHGASRGHLSRPIVPTRRREITPNRQKGFGGGRRPYDYAAYEREEATLDYMRRLFEQHEYPVSERELQQFWLFYTLLREKNAELDLTRIMGIEATVLKHFIDCAIVADMVELKGPVLDIGSGPGFPGAPIAIRKPELPVILAESRGKRVGFLELVKKTLPLENATVFGHSVREDNAPPAHCVITRAVESIPLTLQRVKPFLPAGGQVVFMKGPQCGQEVTDAQQGFKGIFKMTADLRYTLPKSDQQRRLVVFERRPESFARGE